MQTFQHTPLNHDSPSIRLIYVLPDLSQDGRIQCTITHGTTEDFYECLSYRWGLPEPRPTILLNGLPFQIRPGLADFLALARGSRPGASHPYWIDALCIHQSDARERSHQVAQMGEIFSKAVEVHVWLGSTPRLSLTGHGFRSGVSFAGVGNYRSQLDSPVLSSLYLLYLRRTSEEDWSSYKYRTAGVSFTTVGKTRFHPSPQEHPLRQELFANEYWSRAWITQEIFLARSVNLVFEHEILSFWALQKEVETCAYFNPCSELIQFRDMLNSLRPRSQSYNSNRLDRCSQFAHILHGLGTKQCSIPRDRMFSILPLYQWSARIRVDYESADAELAVAVLNSLHESPTFCSLTIVAHSLQPQVCTPDTGFVDMSFEISDLHWGLLRISGIPPYGKETMNGNRPKVSPCYTRILEGIVHPPIVAEAGDWLTECKAWVLARKFILSKITLVGIPDACTWDDVCTESIVMDIALTSMRHHSKDNPRALPGAGNSRKWRLYADGVKFRASPEIEGVWTMRVSLKVVWEFIKTWDGIRPLHQLEPCPYRCATVEVGSIVVEND